MTAGSSRSAPGPQAAHERPREKLARNGVSALGDAELLAVLIGHGSGNSSAVASADAVLALAGGVHGLPPLRREQLERIAGIGPAQAGRIVAAIELGRRTLTTPEGERPRFLRPHETAQYLLPRYGSHPVERFGVLMLDTRYRLIACRLLSIGSLDASLANPREVLREALLAAAPVLVAFHNHPSGDPTPSQDDIQLTRRLRMAGSVVGVSLLDHLILAGTRYCSLKEMQVL
jgi:DNA repair protein RadC